MMHPLVCARLSVQLSWLSEMRTSWAGSIYRRTLARDIPGAQLVVLKQAAHGLLTECAEATAASMMDFLSNLGKRENH